MPDNFINNITVSSFGYDFYEYEPDFSLIEEINVQSSVSSNIVANFILSGEVDSQFIVTSDSTRIVILSASITIDVITTADTQTQALYSASATIVKKFNVNAYSTDRFSNQIIQDSFGIKAFYILDNLPLSEHNRTTSSSVQISTVSNANWRGSKSVYYKKNGVKKSFSFQWRMIPGKRENTVDNNLGRDGISIKANDSSLHTLEIKNLDTDGVTPYTTEVYNVFITDYSEVLIRRDLVGDDYYWDCNLSLEEV